MYATCTVNHLCVYKEITFYAKQPSAVNFIIGLIWVTLNNASNYRTITNGLYRTRKP